MKYIVNINGRDYQVEYDESTPAEVSLDGKRMNVNMQQGTHHQNVHMILENESLMFWIERNEEGYHAHCQGRDFNITVEDEQTRRLKTMLKASGAKTVAGTVKASMPGLVVKTMVEPGETVTKGQGLVIVEAMKMENEIQSPVNGKVVKVHVAPQQAVEKGETLLTIEPDA